MFDIKKGKRLTKAAMKPGNVSFIGSSASNHGITAKIANDSCLHPENTITVSYNGSVGEVFYQTEKFWASDDINVLYSKHVLNEPIALYYCAVIRKCGKKYGYAYKWTKEFMEQDCIPLPITKAGEIDFAFMESRIREMEESRIREMEAYLKVAGFEDCELTEEERETLTSLKSKHFCDFEIKKLFEINTGRDIIIGRVFKGSIPLISHQHDNNGISKRISKLEGRRLFDHNKTISLADRGVFYATTQIEDFHIGTRVKALIFKNGDQSENIRLFIITAINKLQVFFTDYLVNATDKLPHLKIKLPVTSTGSIDYKFMETYIRAIEKLTIQRVQDWRAKEIATTKTVVNEGKNVTQLQPRPNSKQYELSENDTPKMVAEDIIIPGSLEVRIRNTKKEELLAGNLDLILMYAIAPSARHKTESACKIALGIKEKNLSIEAVKAFESVRYIIFHYWKNSEATSFNLTTPACLVNKQDIPEGFLIRQEKEAKQYLLIEYDSEQPFELGKYDILKVQKKGNNRYLPFVCNVDNIK